MILMTLVLSIVFSCLCSTDLTCFQYRKFINVTSRSESEQSDVDVVLTIDVEDLISSSKLENCSFLRFVDDTTLLNFFVENACNSQNTKIWVNIATLPVSGLTITMYYGCEEYDDLPVAGSEFAWEGRFFVGTNSTTCPGGWDDIDVVSKDRFVFLDQTYAGVGDESQDYENHFHDVNVTLEECTGESFFPLTEDSSCGGGCVFTTTYPQDHWHRWNDFVTSSIPKPTCIPPYHTLKGCESRFLDLREGFILPLNSTDFSSFGDMALYGELDNRLLVFSDTPGTADGAATHYHDWSVVSPPADFLGEALDNWYDPTNKIVFIGDDVHDHGLVTFETTPHSNIPNEAQFPFVYMMENDTISVPYLYFVSSLPPLGYHDAGMYDRYIKGGTTIDWDASVASITDETVDIGSVIHGTTELTPEVWNGCVEDTSPQTYEYTHVHDFAVWEVTSNYTGSYDPNDLNNFQVQGAVRKNFSGDVEIGLEQDLLWCYGMEARETESCGEHGTCIASQHCDCDSDWFGEEICNVTFCYGFFSNETASCGEHGTCIGPEICDCDPNWFGVDVCNITRCNGYFSNETESCGEYGTCTGPEYCDCDPNWFGEEICNVTMCNGFYTNETVESCGEHGTCLGPDYCHCEPNWFGEDICNITHCNGLYSNETDSCGERGTCVGPEICECDPNWFSQEAGAVCDISYCYGVFSNETLDVCSGHGNCSDFDDCECEEHYNYSVSCERYFCYGVLDDDLEDVCSGHGDCVSPDECVCTSSDYSGDKCNYWSCFNVSALLVDFVCNGHGVCIDQDFCLCTTGYSTETTTDDDDEVEPCMEFFCGDYFKTEEGVCNSRGSCESSHMCSCRDSYEGNLCQTWSCGYQDHGLAIACSGNGECLDPDVCDCSAGFSGDLCENNDLYALVMAPVLSAAAVVATFLICCCISCSCCLVCICAGVGVSIFVAAISVVVRQRLGLKKFKKLKNFDIFLKEQELEEDTSIAHLRIKRTLFEIDYNEIEIVSIIGEGGSNSIVYKSNWKGQICAFKCFRTRLVCQTQDKFEEFEREVEILGNVSHPFVIRFFGASLKPPRVGILMEFCDNGELLEFVMNYRVEEKDGYPLIGKIRMAIEIGSSMEYLHSRKIIHRDLKCENVLVDAKETCRLMDFGLSRAVDRMSVNKTLRVGTAVYMAPELVSRRRGGYSEKCDVFSYSILLWVLLTENDQPYGSESGTVEFKVANDASFRPPLSEVRVALSSESKSEYDIGYFDVIKEILLRCWDDSEEKRLSFVEINEKLNEMVKGKNEQKKVEHNEEESDNILLVEKVSEEMNDSFDDKEMVLALKKKLKKMKENEILLEDRISSLRTENEKLKQENGMKDF